METYILLRVLPFLSSFKSYYVVWKRCCQTMHPTTTPCLNRTMQYGNIEFSRLTQENKKSLNRTMQYGNVQTQNLHRKKKKKFKSYYVVWKPSKVGLNKTKRVSLNRTMQYGNTSDSFVYNLNFQSLNRTMQYGNFSASCVSS